jgi:uncharacterized membrane protein HdeD (DUF308 family)
MAQKVKKSEIIWTSLLAIIMILSGIFCFELLGAIWVFGTLLVLAHAMDMISGPPNKYYSSLWCYLFPITWILFFFCGLIFLCKKFYEVCIEPINKKINKE